MPSIISHSARIFKDSTMPRRIKIWSIAAAIWFVHAAVLGQGAYQIRLKADPDTVSAGQDGVLDAEIRLSEGYHVTAPGSGLFSVEPEPKDGVEFQEPRYPQGIKDKFGEVYKGVIHVRIPFKTTPAAVPGAITLSAKVTIQQCGESQGVCYPPEDVRVETRLLVREGRQAAPEPAEAGSKDIAGRVSDALAKGTATAFLLVFLGGLLTGFTPCVYPMIPITIAVIGAQASGKKLSGFIISLFYVLGIGVTFSVLGMIAAKTGSLFGSAMNHPILKVVISVIFLVMGLSMLGAFVMQMPPALAARFHGKKRKGFFGAFLTGMVAGLIVSPCISPLLVVILAWVAKSGSLPLGFGLLFTFAMGLGVLFIIIGTFSGALRALPKSGFWMEWIERGFGILLVTLAVVFVKPVVSPFFYSCLWAVTLVFYGTFSGAFTPLDRESGGRQKTGKAVSVLLVMAGGIMLFQAFTGGAWNRAIHSGTGNETGTGTESAVSSGIPWISSETEAFRAAEASGRYVLLDFYAEWCAACRELDQRTWPDAEVQKAAAGFIPVRMDMTGKNELNAGIQKKYHIIGMPTVIVADSRGREIGRFTGYQSPEAVTAFLRKNGR
jgi:thiol:disulfide interchange protein DsbD